MAPSVNHTATKQVDPELAGLSPYFINYLAFVPKYEQRPDGTPVPIDGTERQHVSLRRIDGATRRHMALHLWLKDQDVHAAG